MYARKVGPFIAPSITKGATMPSWRKPATKVIVFQCPCGTDATSRSPRGQRPLGRTMFVLVALSSINTSRAVGLKSTVWDPIRVLFQWRDTPAAAFGRHASCLAPALTPADDRTNTHPEDLGHLPPRRSALNCFKRTLTQIGGIRLRHRSSSSGESISPDSPRKKHLGIPPIQCRREML